MSRLRRTPDSRHGETDASRSSGAIDRREALRQAALLLGGSLSAPAVAGVLAGCDAPTSRAAQAPARALSPAQLELVATIADHILPATDTPGARAAGVDRFIDRMMAEYYSASDRQRFVAGLGDVDERAKRAQGHAFLKCTPAQQHAILSDLDREAFTGARPPSHFFRTMKELTVVGYYTSQIGATKELRHASIPGRFDGCVPVGKTWAV